MSETEIIIAMLTALFALAGWLFLDNRKGHDSIYTKLHKDHEYLQTILMDLYEKMGGKRDKE